MDASQNLAADFNQFVVRDIASFEISANDRTSYNLALKEFNGSPYVGFGQFFYHRGMDKWLPTKKQFFMPVSVWLELPKFAGRVNDALKRDADADNDDDIVEPLIVASSSFSGMNAIPR